MVESSKNSFSKTIKNFDPKDEKQTLELKKILNSYPYFQSSFRFQGQSDDFRKLRHIRNVKNTVR